MPNNFPHGVYSMGALVGPMGIPLGGTHFYVKPYSGLDGNDGLTPETALKTLSAALAKCTANKNDVVHLIAESNTAASTTDYQSATLDWNKDMTHLIGEAAPGVVSHRARVAFISTYTTASNLFTLSANGCIIRNTAFFAGVADTHPTGCMKVTGQRNWIQGCHIAGIGHNSMDIAGAYSLNLNNASENTFVNCTIGLTTIARGSASNHEILSDGGTSCARNSFFGCNVVGWCESAGNYVFLKATANYSVEDWMLFKDCLFINPSTSKAGGAAMTQAMNVAGSINGYVLLHNCGIFGAGNNNVADNGLILATGGLTNATTDATDLGIAVAVTAA